MLMKEADCDGIPPFEDVFRDDEDETFQVHIQHHRVPCMRYEFINVPFKSFDDLYTVWKWSQALWLTLFHQKVIAIQKYQTYS